jgi:hypothetical protein
LREILRLASAEGGSIDAKALEEGFTVARTSLSLLEHAFDKAEAIVAMNEAELGSYTQLQDGIGNVGHCRPEGGGGLRFEQEALGGKTNLKI